MKDIFRKLILYIKNFFSNVRKHTILQKLKLGITFVKVMFGKLSKFLMKVKVKRNPRLQKLLIIKL